MKVISDWLSRHPLLPASLAARTSLLLIVGFAVLEIVGLTIETLDRLAFDDRLASHQAVTHAIMAYRTVAEASPEDRADEVRDLQLPTGFRVRLADRPDADMTFEVSAPDFRRLLFIPGGFPDGPPGGPAGFQSGPGGPHRPDDAFRGPGGPMGGGGPSMDFPSADMPDGKGGAPGLNTPRFPIRGPQCDPRMDGHHPPFLLSRWHPQRVVTLPDRHTRRRGMALLLPGDTRWLVIRYRLPVPTPFSSPAFPIAFGLMTAGGCILIIWGMRRMIAPVGTLAAAAEAFAPDASSPQLPQNGPTEIARAAAAFNAMAVRIRRYILERTHLLTAIGHDLRTPITRLKLRAEFIEDDEMREKFLKDLNELSAMVESTLAFGRDSSAREAVTPLDLTALLATVVDDVGESRPDDADRIILAGDPPPVIIRGRPLALKRAFMNLVNNAIIYGGSATVTLSKPEDGYVTVLIEDEGPGLPPADLERMFEPFVRAEESRNRETGGTGLGLSITRTIIRGQGGDVMLYNRKPQGLAVRVTLVA
ncbi:sensor histidine kinase [Acetobacter fallax]|uniref:histidine kinase n=1 Tax=Acetobacter fallax TaxID=1737473 RepID=A0ABX0K6F0_9PROT|nr:ATP-binding protein [Acetobacter fallax]NHO31034.1 HAMP domain-containing protein [Acetobacter fallax]NHO34591.1 HAMP domain-containing protein [Acetobacter fallax]